MSEPVASGYDAFVSYASVDRRHARRIQHFLERWVDKASGRRLKVFRDETDIRGGRLDAELAGAVRRSRTFVICYSKAAADSRWVAEELRIFREASPDDRVAVAIVGGDERPDAVGQRLAEGVEFRVHDMRRSAFSPLHKTLELLRLLAFVAEVDMRSLRNWHLRRTALRWALTGVATVVPLALLLNLPVDRWHPVPIKKGKEEVPLIAAEVNDGKLLAVARYRGAGPQGFRNYFEVMEDVLSDKPKAHFGTPPLRHRLLPLSLLPMAQRRDVPAVDIAASTKRAAAGEAMAGEIRPGQWLVIMPLALTEEERDEATNEEADFSKPILRTKNFLAVTALGGEKNVVEVEGTALLWEPNEANVGPTSPAHAMPVAVMPNGDIWMGVEGKQGREPGGLWLYQAATKTWVRQPGFASVNSVHVRATAAGAAEVIVVEQHLDAWRGIRLVTLPTRMRIRPAGGGDWRDYPGPPFGSQSDVEVAGYLGEDALVRVDGAIYRHGSVPLWRLISRP